jgi:xylulokinase
MDVSICFITAGKGICAEAILVDLGYKYIIFNQGHQCKGSFLGASLRHDRSFMARAVMEGVTMSLKDCIELRKQRGTNTTQVRLSGGGSRSALWQQMVADIFELGVVRVGIDEGPAYGAAIIAAVGT